MKRCPECRHGPALDVPRAELIVDPKSRNIQGSPSRRDMEVDRPYDGRLEKGSCRGKLCSQGCIQRHALTLADEVVGDVGGVTIADLG